MSHIKKFENFKNILKKHVSNFEDTKRKTEPITITIDSKRITYNPFDREIINDENYGKYVVLDNYSLDMNHVEEKHKKELINFIKNNVGEIITAKLGGGKCYYDIKYNNIPRHLEKYFTQRSYDQEPRYLISNILDHVGTYDDCSDYIIANKYNL